MDAHLGNIAVTGANGNLARVLFAALAAAGVPATRMLGLVRRPAAAQAVAALPEAHRPRTAVVDYRDPKALARALEGCSMVVHLVGILKESATTSYGEAHETSCFSLTQAAEQVGVQRIVYLSILGSRPDARNPCLASKGRAEAILLERETQSLVLRVPMVLGRGDPASRALRGQALARFVPMVRGGATLEQPIGAGDVAAAIISGLLREEPVNTALDLAGPECLTHRALVERIASLHGRRGPRVIPLPLWPVRGLARFAEWVFANPPITPAMLDVLERDDQIDPTPTTRTLGIELTPLDRVLAQCVGPDAEAP